MEEIEKMIEEFMQKEVVPYYEATAAELLKISNARKEDPLPF